MYVCVVMYKHRPLAVGMALTCMHHVCLHVHASDKLYTSQHSKSTMCIN